MSTEQTNGAAGAQESTGNNTNAFIIPDAYKDKEHFKNFKSHEDVFKAYDNAQSLIGKRPAGIPQDNASPEEWDKFYNSVGRPDSFDKYEFDNVELPKGLERNAEIDKKVKEIFHAAGLSAKQAKLIQSKYDQLMVAELKKNQEQSQQEDVNFDKLASEVFGDRKDKALAVSKKILTDNAPEKMKAHIANLSSDQLILLASVLDSINSKYIKEDVAPSGGGGGTESDEAKRTKAKELMASSAWKDWRDPKHQQVQEEVKAIYASLK